MISPESCILTLNGGSSSIKFSVYRHVGGKLSLVLSGEMESSGQHPFMLHFTRTRPWYADDAAPTEDPGHQESVSLGSTATSDPSAALSEWLGRQDFYPAITAIGHRIVYGMEHPGPALISTELLEELTRLVSFDPEHLPAEIRLIEKFKALSPDLPQVACFDTSFHFTMPELAKLLPVPRRYSEKGIRRYGFHGLSYAFLLSELERTAGTKKARGRVILAHLGSGASMAAVLDLKPVDTSMGLTPAAGLVMGTRTGDLDPGLAWYFMAAEQMDAAAFSHLVNHESGLLGVSETSGDMRVLHQSSTVDFRAAQAIALFCYQAKKQIGAFAAVLDGVDTLIFSGGIGENDAAVRALICQGLAFLGIELDSEKNIRNESLISAGKTEVRVIKTNEELMIARSVSEVLNLALN